MSLTLADRYRLVRTIESCEDVDPPSSELSTLLENERNDHWVELWEGVKTRAEFLLGLTYDDLKFDFQNPDYRVRWKKFPATAYNPRVMVAIVCDWILVWRTTNHSLYLYDRSTMTGYGQRTLDDVRKSVQTLLNGEPLDGGYRMGLGSKAIKGYDVKECAMMWKKYKNFRPEIATHCCQDFLAIAIATDPNDPKDLFQNEWRSIVEARLKG